MVPAASSNAFLGFFVCSLTKSVNPSVASTRTSRIFVLLLEATACDTANTACESRGSSTISTTLVADGIITAISTPSSDISATAPLVTVVVPLAGSYSRLPLIQYEEEVVEGTRPTSSKSSVVLLLVTSGIPGTRLATNPLSRDIPANRTALVQSPG